jgi:galactokinase/mevalonate kinase-like predicted kinase
MAAQFESLTDRRFPEWMASSDPEGGVGSGGGTAWLLAEAWRREGGGLSFEDWIASGRRLIIHSGGKSRRLPEFAPQGKVFMPIPPREGRGARALTWLLDDQVEFGDDVFDRAPERIKVVILAGDVLFRVGNVALPTADLSMAGMTASVEEAGRHGVFVPDELGVVKQVMQKPAPEILPRDWLLDIGIWGLSKRAVLALMSASGWTGSEFMGGVPRNYDLYSEFGPSLVGSDLSVKVCEVTGEFIHLGTTEQFRDYWKSKTPLASLEGLPDDDHERFFARQRAQAAEGLAQVKDRSRFDLRQARELGATDDVTPDYARFMMRGERELAFAALRDAIVDEDRIRATIPKMGSQTVTALAPLRLDLAGGWSDTPPYCLHFGGLVINLAVEWGEQAPSAAWVEPLDGPQTEVMSVDRGQTFQIEPGTDLKSLVARPGLPTIGLAALYLCGYEPGMFDHGLRLTMESRAPEGSGLGASSILAATVLGALSEFFGLKWTHEEIVWRTLCLEQLIGSHGGWQDQAGGINPGLKLLATEAGFHQKVVVQPLEDHLLRDNPCLLLYNTGIQRRAFGVLGDIVEGMFLNDHDRLRSLTSIKLHATQMLFVVDRSYERFGAALRRSWDLNQRLDPGTNTPSIQGLLDPVDDLMYGGKLLGAGGGGFFLAAAKDEAAAQRIRKTWTEMNPQGQFMDWRIADRGLVVESAK